MRSELIQAAIIMYIFYEWFGLRRNFFSTRYFHVPETLFVIMKLFCIGINVSKYARSVVLSILLSLNYNIINMKKEMSQNNVI